MEKCGKSQKGMIVCAFQKSIAFTMQNVTFPGNQYQKKKWQMLAKLFWIKLLILHLPQAYYRPLPYVGTIVIVH